MSLILLSSRLFPSFIMIRCHVMRPCHSLRGNQMRATNFRLETWGMNWGHSEILTPSLHLLLTLAGNLVRKLFRVCLWTMQSQVRLIQKEAQHKRRSYACSDDCCYSLAIVVVDYPPPPLYFLFRKLRRGILISLCCSTAVSDRLSIIQITPHL